MSSLIIINKLRLRKIIILSSCSKIAPSPTVSQSYILKGWAILGPARFASSKSVDLRLPYFVLYCH